MGRHAIHSRASVRPDQLGYIGCHMALATWRWPSQIVPMREMEVWGTWAWLGIMNHED